MDDLTCLLWLLVSLAAVIAAGAFGWYLGGLWDDDGYQGPGPFN